jgi:6-pyruvoyltetrahydropterin/6-carboxytetrahydropterin synthase
MNYTVTRQIGIDAGHRIATHGSKCRHMHGHRYAIEATCRAMHLHQAGEQTGMVLDFGFLKEEMMAVIDAPCDHGFIVAWDDLEVLGMFVPAGKSLADWQEDLRAAVRAAGYAGPEGCRMGQKLYVVPFQPTAECLARHWFERLRPAVERRSDGLAALTCVRVWETPNCYAEYSA